VCEPNAFAVKADPGSMQQVILNLVANGRDAMPEGGRLSIAVFNEAAGYRSGDHGGSDDPGRYVSIVVKDTGRGMGPDVARQAFEPFFTTKDKGQGTGLGLSTVYGIVQQAGGQVEIDSEPGRGTSVKVSLPATGDAVKEERRPSLPPPTDGGGRAVLVVEDEAAIVRLIRRVLARGGYRVLEARSGAEAVQIASKDDGGIDLLLTDVVMPHMSGTEAADRIKDLHPDIKVLFMSGYTDDRLDQAGLSAEGVSFIQKPFTVNGLLNKVREVMG
jgi:CheY-like chemotaxis protein